MVDGIGARSPLAKEAIQAALQAQAERAADVRSKAQSIGSELESASSPATAAGFRETLARGLAAVDAEVHGVEELPQQLLTGKVDDFHEVAVQLKQAEFSFRFAMEIRNKLIDAYREVMRMNV